MRWFLDALTKNYATFGGRARRREYWHYVLFYCLALIACIFVDVILGTFNAHAGVGVLGALFVLATAIPSFAVTARRLHDTNRSGWWQLLSAIPLVGAIIVLVFTVQDSQPGANRFGPNPKGVIGAGTPSPIIVRDW
jgi:uncharacterized membrane protein YhaH (DUF805 family)